jgi:catechol 2,3-dioxygenase-like lactoylglutathione lyase family enzyme
MSNSIRASRDVIIRTEGFEAATQFYETVLGLPIFYRSPSMIGFETGGIRLYVEQGPQHGPVFDFLVPDLPAAKRDLIAAGCVVIEENPAVPRCYLRDPHGLVFNIEHQGA